MRICEYVITTYFDTVFEKEGINENSREIVILFLKCELFGLLIDWINNGMAEDAIVKLIQTLDIGQDNIIFIRLSCHQTAGNSCHRPLNRH